MIDLEAELRAAPTDTAILLTYSVGLGHFEREILPSFLASGERSDILILADAEQVQETFSEIAAISGPGVEYRLHGVHLRRPGAVFHPKLYLLLGDEEASVWIASANLTLFGFRVNAEVVERLQLTQQDATDRAAWLDVASLLEAVPSLDPSLGPGPTGILVAAATELRRRGARARESELRVLHNARTPLLDQLVGLVPAAEVQEIHVVTPFFDRDATALLALAEAYPTAAVHVITGPNAAGTLDGSQVESWPAPPVLDIYKAPEGDSRRSLHAKLYIFIGRGRAWTLAGSPNLSDAAWRLAAATQGNLECALLRPWDDIPAVRSLLTTLDREPGTWGSLVARGELATSLPGVAVTPPLPVAAAERMGDRLELRLAGGTLAAGDAVSLRLELRAGLVERTCSLDHMQDGTWRAIATIEGADVQLPDAPVIVRVRARSIEGGVREGRVWLSQRHLLDRNNWQRRAAGLAAGYAGTMADDEALAFADLLVQVTSEIVIAQQRGGAGPPQRPGEPPDVFGAPERTVLVEDLVRTGEHRVGGEGLSRASRDALEQVFRSLSYWEPPDEG